MYVQFTSCDYGEPSRVRFDLVTSKIMNEKLMSKVLHLERQSSVKNQYSGAVRPCWKRSLTKLMILLTQASFRFTTKYPRVRSGICYCSLKMLSNIVAEFVCIDSFRFYLVLFVTIIHILNFCCCQQEQLLI